MNFQMALVTGATSGIGKELCFLLARKGVNLIVTGRNRQELALLEKRLSQNVHVQVIPADLSSPDERKALITVLHQQVPDLVINNAGIGLYGDALTYSLKQQSEILEVDAQAVLELTLEATRAMISKGIRGVVLNVSSAAAFQIFPTMAVYVASKAFVNHFSQALDFEVKPYGIRVLTACPGMVATDFQIRAGGKDMGRQAWVMSASFVAEQIWRQIERQTPLKIIDWRYRLLTYFTALLPKSLTAAIEKRIIASRINPRTIIHVDK